MQENKRRRKRNNANEKQAKKH